MVLVLLILAIYVLSHFTANESWVRHVFSGVSFPKANVVEEILPGVDVIVGKRKVLVYGVPAADVSDAWEDESFFVHEIAERLNDVKRCAQLLPPDKFRFRRITINADRRTPFRIIRNIMHTATSLGYTEIQFLVGPKG